MAKKNYIQRISSSEDGIVHINDLNPSSMLATACGDCDTGYTYTDVNTKITCNSCLDIYNFVKDGVTLIKRGHHV